MKHKKLTRFAAFVVIGALLLWGAYQIWGPPDMSTIAACERLEQRLLGLTKEEVRAMLGEPNPSLFPTTSDFMFEYSTDILPETALGMWLGRFHKPEVRRFAVLFDHHGVAYSFATVTDEYIIHSDSPDEAVYHPL